MLAVIIYLNYYHSLEYRLSNTGMSTVAAFAGSYIIYFLPFAIAYLIQIFFYKDCSFLRKKWFWIILIIAPAIFALRMNFDLHHTLIKRFWQGDEQLFWIRCAKWFTGLFTVLIPVYLIWRVKDSKLMPFYGMERLKNTMPYLLMVLCMIPLITVAATQADFLKMYPRAKVVTGWQLHPKTLYYILHEIFYSMDFITIEIFFRGFLVLSLVNLCGKQCILPAACFYCCIHLGKPMGEAISSFAGGLLLGIISYNTRSIRGGLMVHLGVAWLMEAAGFIAHQYYRQ